MGSHMTEVGKGRPCPICGHDHACKFLEGDDGKISVMCLRIHEHINLLGTDGRKYTWSADSKDGGWSIFRPYTEKRYHKLPPRNSAGNNKAGAAVRAAAGGDAEFKRPEAQKQVKMEEEIPPLPNERMNELIRFIQGKLVLDERHRKYLQKAGWTDSLMFMHRVRSFPESDAIRAQYGNRTGSRNMSRRELASACESRFGKGCLEGFPGAYVGEDGYWTFAGPSGIAFPMYDPDGKAFRIRIRMDYMDINRNLKITEDGAEFSYDGDDYKVSMKGVFVKEEGSFHRLDDDTCGRRGKYRTLSSHHPSRETGKNVYSRGTRSANEASVYCTPVDKLDMCYIVEGEPKSIYSNFILQRPVISVPGVNSYDVLFKKGVIDKMREKGCELYVVAYDADKATNQMVLDFEGRLVNALKEKGLNVMIADWDQSVGKGLDDLLVAGGKPSFRMP